MTAGVAPEPLALVAAALLVGGSLACWPRPPADPSSASGGAGRDGARRLGGRVAWWVGRARDFVGRSGRPRAVARRREDAVVAVLDALAAALEAGLPPAFALREAAGAAQERAVRGLFTGAAGADVGPGVAAYLAGQAAAVGDGRRRARGLTGVALLARAWALSERLGTPLAEAVRTVATLARADIAAAQAVASAMAEARATVMVLVALPVLGPLLALAVGVAPGDLYGSPAALGSTAVGMALLGAGWAWLRRLLRRVAEAGEAG